MALFYIKFKANVLTTSEQKLKSWSDSTTDDFATKILNKLTPNVNPDFDEQVPNVKEWILEVDDEDGMPMREIGLDDKGNTIMILPWRENYGFWSDSIFYIDNLAFSHSINLTDIAEFEKLWNKFERGNDQSR